MKIRFTGNTNIRQEPTSSGNKPLGIVYAGTELEVEDVAHTGASISNNAVWYRDLNGWYYWSGKTQPVFSPTPLPPPQQPMPPLAPAAPQVAEPTRPPIPAFPTDLPLPEHEMSAPLLEGEMRIPTADTAGASAVSDLESFVAAPAPPKPPTPEPPPPPPLLWKNPERQRLHWAHAGLTAWWSERQLTGRGVRIALLSTGADLGHPDLQGAVGAVFDALRPEAAQAGADVHGLGTQAAVVAAGRGHIAFGAAPEATLLIGKIGDYDHEITPESLLAGLHWALHQQAHIIAMLVDFRELSTTQREALESAIALAQDANVLLLAPVGNSTERRPENRFPASLEGVICIGAHDQYGQRCAFSAKSQHLDVLAPGEGLLSTDLQRQPVVAFKNTSIATAFAAGMLALVRQSELERHLPTIACHDFLERLRHTASANKAITQGNDVGYGYGLLHPAALLQAVG